MNNKSDNFASGLKSSWLLWLTVCLLLVIHASLSLTATSTKSATFDEPIHFIGGVSYWRYNDYRIQPENGNLAQRIAGLPNYLLPGVPQGMENDPGWRRGSGFHTANTFLFGQNVDHDKLLLRGRAMVVLVSVLLGLMTFIIARRLWGKFGGLVSLVVYTFHPAIMANAGVLTSDIIAAFFFTLTMWALWSSLHRLTLARLAGLILASSGLALSKFSFPVFFPMALLVLAAVVVRNKPWRIGVPGREFCIGSRAARLASAGGLVAVVVAGVFFFVWAAYGFRYQALAPGLDSGPDHRMFTSLEQLLGQIPRSGQVIGFFAAHKLLPEAFLCGMAFVMKFAEGRGSLAAGEFSLSGVWWFYPVSLFYKTPLACLMLVTAGAALVVQRLRLGFKAGVRSVRARRFMLGAYRASPWMILVVVYMVIAMNMQLNIGVRHVLPALIAGIILIGYVGKAASPVGGLLPVRMIKPAARAVWVLCLLVVVESCLVWPNYISYFNRLLGPADEAYRQFSDSNLDWGQDLPGLRKWALDNGYQTGTRPDGGSFYLSYFGSARVRAYAVPGTYINCYFAQPDQAVLPVEYRPGHYAISATKLIVMAATWGPGWNQLLESAYIERRDFFQRFFATRPNSPERASVQAAMTHAQVGAVLQEFEELRFARFCVFLRQRTADVQINQTINIYKVSAEDLRQYFYGPAPASDGYEPVIR